MFKSSKNKSENSLVTILAIIGIFAIVAVVILTLITGIVAKKVVKLVAENNFENAQVLAVKQDFSKVANGNLSLTLNSGDIVLENTDSAKLITGQFKYLGNQPLVKFTSEGKTGTLSIKSTDGKNKQATLYLPKSLPFAINTTVGAGNIIANLSNLNLPGFDVNTGAGNISVTFPNITSLKSNMNTGAGNIDLSIPKSAGSKVTISESSGVKLKVPSDFIKTGNIYKSKNYEKAKVKLDIQVASGAGNINIQSY